MAAFLGVSSAPLSLVVRRRLSDVHESLIDNLRRLEGLNVEERDSSWLIRIPDRAGYRFEVVIPKDVLEWFVNAYDVTTGDEVWSDWTDWYSVDGDPPEDELPNHYADDVTNFILRVTTCDAYRIAITAGVKFLWWSLFTSKRLEGRIDGKWNEL